MGQGWGKILPALILLSFCLGSCRKPEDVTTATPKPEKELKGYFGNSNSNRVKTVHLFADTVYLLNENFERQDGEQLIIDPGTLVKCNVVGSPVGITIREGGLINANGTRERPIVFTANARAGTQKDSWNGLHIYGKAPRNNSSRPSIKDDNSGVLKYVRVEFGSLLLTGVGSGTEISQIMVSYAGAPFQQAARPAFWIEGGNVSIRNAISYASNGPADFYLTAGYSGNMQGIIALRHPYFGNTSYDDPTNTLAGLVVENAPSGYNRKSPRTWPVISNMTVIGPDTLVGSPASYKDTSYPLANSALITSRNAAIELRNSVFLGYPGASWYVDDWQTSNSLAYDTCRASYSIFQGKFPRRWFFLLPGAYIENGREYTSEDFENFMLNPRFGNRRYEGLAPFGFVAPFDETRPDVRLLPGSPLQSGANYDDPYFDVPFFVHYPYIGAMGSDDWASGWTNFQPLKTDYNFPR
jgi:hypothetical protein